MTNPQPVFPSNSGSMPDAKLRQGVSDTKFSTKQFAAGVVPVSTDFFTTPPVADPTQDNYDAGNQLVTSDKIFVINAVCVNIFPGAAATIADVDTIINRGVIVLTQQQKEVGRFRVRHLCAGGGTFVAGAQVAAGALPGVINGTAQADPYRIAEIRASTNQTVKATLLMPSTVPVTLTGILQVEVDFLGYEGRPLA